MKKYLTSILFVGLVGSVFLLGSCNQDETAFGPQNLDAYHSTVTGRVTDRHGQKLSGALVVALPGGNTTVSAPDGSFQLSGLKTGTYRIALAKDSYRDTIALDSVGLGMSVTKNVDTLKMIYRYATIQGVVEDSFGHGLPTAGIAVENQTPTSMATSDGKFLLSKVEPGRIRLFSAIKTAEYSGYATLDTLLRADDTLKGMHLRIEHVGGNLVGQVVDNDGKGIPGAKVQLLGGALVTFTGTDGTFTITQVPSDGKIVVTVTSGGNSAILTGVSVGEGGKTNLFQIKLDAPSSNPFYIRSGQAFAYTSDATVTLVADVVVPDSSFHILRYAWSIDNGDHWDSTSTNTRLVDPIPASWNAKLSTNTVLVRAITLDGKVSGSGKIVVHMLPPPDRQGPTITMPADQIFEWDTTTQSILVHVHDDGGVDSVWVKGQKANLVGSENYSVRLKWAGPDTNVTFFARDSAWNHSTVSFQLTHKDTKAPRIARVDQAKDTLVYEYNDTARQVSWMIKEEHLASVTINGKGFSADVNGMVTVSVKWGLGDTTLVVNAFDSSNNSSSDRITVRHVNTRAPDVVRFNPKDTTYTYPWPDSVVVRWQLTNDPNHQDSVWINGARVTDSIPNIYQKKIGLTKDTNLAVIKVVDPARGTSYDTVRILRTARAKSDSSLASLVVGTDSVKCDGNRVCLEQVAYIDTTAKVTATPNDPKAKVLINSDTVTTKNVSLVVAPDTTLVTVRVVATDGDTLKYTLKVIHAPAPGPGPYLDSMWVGSKKLLPYSDTTSLADTVASGIAQVQVNAYPHNSTDSIYINSIPSAGAGTVNLSNPNSNTVLTVKLVAQDKRTRVFTVNIWRTKLPTTPTVKFPGTNVWVLDTIQVPTGDSLVQYRLNQDTTWHPFLQGLVLTELCPNAATCSLTVKEVAPEKAPVYSSKNFTLVTYNPHVVYGAPVVVGGQSYRTVSIGGVTWMAENLNNDGTLAAATRKAVVGASRKTSLSSIGHCYGDSAVNCTKYGRLYTWAEAMGLDSSYNSSLWGGGDSLTRQGPCPSGWHVPSQAAWSNLLAQVGNQSVVGAKLKSITGWIGRPGFDNSGFTVFPAGQMHQTRTGSFDQFGADASFWTASDNPNGASSIELNNNWDSTHTSVTDKSYGFSLRCVEGAASDTSTGLKTLSLSAVNINHNLSQVASIYVDSLPAFDTTFTLTALPTSPGALVTYNGSSSGHISFGGSDTVLVTVRVANGASVALYTVKVYHRGPSQLALTVFVNRPSGPVFFFGSEHGLGTGCSPGFLRSWGNHPVQDQRERNLQNG